MFSQFSFSECVQLQVYLNNDVLIKQGSLQGTYQKSQMINRRSSWITAIHAIWFIPELDVWAIGRSENVGTIIRGITFICNQGLKVASTYWDGQWKAVPSGDIVINCVTNKDRNTTWNACTEQRLSVLRKDFKDYIIVSMIILIFIIVLVFILIIYKRKISIICQQNTTITGKPKF